MRPDILAGLSAAQRRRREAKEAGFLRRAPQIDQRVTAATALEVANLPGMTWAGTNVFKHTDFEVYAGGPVALVICARLDLDHPLYFADNLFGDCEDCGCNLQWRPHAPPGPRLCVCCAARRVREESPR